MKLAKYGLILPVTETTVKFWIRRLGCTSDRHRQSYKREGHERPWRRGKPQGVPQAEAAARVASTHVGFGCNWTP